MRAGILTCDEDESGFSTRDDEEVSGGQATPSDSHGSRYACVETGMSTRTVTHRMSKKRTERSVSDDEELNDKSPLRDGGGVTLLKIAE